MGAIVSSYLVNLDQLRATYGSRDHALRRDIEARFASELDELTDEPQTVSAGSSRPNVREALAAVIDGDVPLEGDGSPYGYALDVLCQYLGRPLPHEEFEDLNSGALAMLATVDGLSALANGWKPPLPIPPPHDLLGMTYITAQEAATLLSALPPIALALPTPLDDDWDDDTAHQWEKEWPLRLQQQYRSWLEEAVRTGNDIVATLF